MKSWIRAIGWRRVLGLVLLIAGASLGTLLLSFHLVELPERLERPGSTVVYWKDKTPAHVFLSPDEKWRIPVTLDEIEPTYVEALIRLEDKRFYSHPGVDPIAISRAVWINLTRGRVVTGASTLTMQLVRVLEPRPRTLRSKLTESWRALQLEWFFTKEEILAGYLTFIPYGRNVEGIEAASLSYFGHRSQALSADEIATLLAVPQNPNIRYPTRKNWVRLREGRDQIATFLVERESMDLADGGKEIASGMLLKQIHDAPIPKKLRRFPRNAPHFASWLRMKEPNRLRFHTTLDEGVQRIAERQMDAAAAHARNQGIRHGVSLIADHQKGELVAVVGNFDFFGGGMGDQIPMFDVPRSPGSALKPFIYALGIDKGLVLPEHLVLDVPAAYRGYAPNNYDGEFDGLVQLEEALSRSLNLPFVFLLQEVGVDTFIGQLRMMGVDSIFEQPGYYGLSVAAGGIEMTPLELISMYTALPSGGAHAPVRWLKSQETYAPVQVITPGAAWLTRRALSIKDRPDFPSRRSFSKMPASIHWKTGTSFGHKDAWAVGSNPRYTALVWMGNADQRSARALVGSSAAGPTLFNVLEGLSAEQDLVSTDAPPGDLMEVEVCAYSGHIAHEACPHRRRIQAISDRVPSKSCPFHVMVEVDQHTGEAVGPGCRGDKVTEKEAFVRWPAVVRRWLDREHRKFPQVPRYAEACTIGGATEPLRILSPQVNQVSVLLPGIPSSQQEIPLEADTRRGVLSWFVNGEYLGEAPASERVWWEPVPGKHEVVVMDEAGGSAKRVFEVRRPI